MFIISMKKRTTFNANVLLILLLADTDSDIVTNYFSRRKNVGLLSLYSYVKESILSQRIKKSF